jgi:hypothetical protein
LTADERLINDLRKLRDQIAKRMNSTPRVYSKVPGRAEEDVTDKLIEADRQTVDELNRIIASAERE